MGLLRIVTEGSWWVTSKTNPEWNGSGDGCVGGLVMPADAEAHIKRKTEELGEPPEDLEWGYMKD